MIGLIVAIAKNGVIGKDQKLPWHISEDLQVFKNTTKDSVVIMGRNTFESIGRPLPSRINIVVSRTQKPVEGIHVVQSLADAFRVAKTFEKNIFVIGGKRIYEESIPYVEKLFISHVHESYDGDTYFPTELLRGWIPIEEHQFTEFTQKIYVRKNENK
ncbi:MAG: dihydrofolate reductase [Candidatus Woesearchaeota archaeon]